MYQVKIQGFLLIEWGRKAIRLTSNLYHTICQAGCYHMAAKVATPPRGVTATHITWAGPSTPESLGGAPRALAAALCRKGKERYFMVF